MKKLLSLTLLVLFFSACSVEPDESVNTQKQLVKKTMQHIYAMGKTATFRDFIGDVKDKTSTSYTEEEIQQIIDDFVAQQSPEFIALFRRVEQMNLNQKELIDLALELKDEIIVQNQPENPFSPGKIGVCEIDNGVFGNTLGAFIRVLFCDDTGTGTDGGGTNESENDDDAED